MPTLIKPVVGGIYNFKFQTGYTKFDGVHMMNIFQMVVISLLIFMNLTKKLKMM